MSIKAETLRRLAQPILDEGAEEIHFTAHANRVYVGRVPAAAIRGAEGEPRNVCLTREEMSDGQKIEQVCTELETMLS